MTGRTRLVFLLLIALAGTACHAGKKSVKTKNPQSSQENDPLFDKHFFDGLTQKSIGNMDKAQSAFMKCYAMAPANAAVNYELARIALVKNDNNSALEFAQRAYEKDKSNKWYAGLMADMFFDTNQFDKAEKLYSDMLLAHPDEVGIYFKLAGTQLYQKKYPAALKTLDRMESVVGINEELIMEKYRIHMNAGQTDKAEAELVRLVNAFPGEVYYSGILAGHYRDTRQNDKAFALFEQMEKTDPENGFVQYYKGEFLLFQGKGDEAFVALEKAIRSSDLEVDMKINLLLNLFGMTEFEQKFLPKSFVLLEAMEATHPDDAKSYSIHGDFLNREGKTAQALEKFRKAVGMDPSRSALWQEVLSLEAQLGKHDWMIEDATKAAELFPFLPDFYYFQGFALTVKKRYAEAIEPLETGLTVLADNKILEAEMHSLLGECYHKTNKYDKSDKAFKKSLSLNPDNATVLNNYAYYLALRKTNLDEALSMSQKSNKLSPGQTSFQDTLGYIYYIKGDYNEAKTWFEKAIKHGGVSSGEVLEHYGDALFKSGDTESAVEHWKMAQTAGGGSPQLNEKISKQKLID